MKKVLIYGIATYKNRGVEAIVKTTIDLLKDYDITIATYDYDNNINKYGDRVKYIHHKYSLDELSEADRVLYNNMSDPREKERLLERDAIAAVKDADICISAGGDNYTYGEEYYLYVLDEEARRQNKKLVFWGGSLFDEIKSEQLVANMSLFDALIIRESITYNALGKYIDKEKIICLPDPAFTLKPKKVEIDDFYKSKVVGLNFSPLTVPKTEIGDPRFDSVIVLIDYILKNTKYNISLIPHVTVENCSDLTTLKAIYKLYKNNNRVRLEEDKYDCSEIKYLISKCSFLIAARTHASIAAYSTNVPTLVIGYSVKSRGIAKDIFGTHKDYVVSSDVLDGDKLKNCFIWLVKNKNKIKKHLKETMPKMISNSSQMQEKMIQLIEKEEKNNTICSKVMCTGCGLCSKICKHNAITMKLNKEGFLYPEIDKDKCTKCNLCKANCPVLNNSEKNEYNKKSYAIKNRDKNIQKKSTSGGLFNIFAEYILNHNGIVYGCEQEGTKVSHIRISKIKDLNKINGTKYNQSSILDIYKDIKNDINSNKKVLFSGTACQVAAIKKFVGDSDNLITISVICHGVMSTKILDKYIEYLENATEEKISDWKFRVKKYNKWIESSINYKIGSENKTVLFENDKLMNLYIKNYILRESCYRCMFKGDYNPADIIIGDAWGIQITNPSFCDQNGVSSVIINTKKGQRFFTSIKIAEKAKKVYFSLDDIKKYNSSYYKNSERPKDRNILFESIDDKNINKMFGEIDAIYNKRELYKREIELKSKEEMIELLKDENAFLNSEISDIYNSIRWKYSTKIANAFYKILRKK